MQMVPKSHVLRDYLMVFWLSPEVSTRDLIISPRALARVDTEGDYQNPML